MSDYNSTPHELNWDDEITNDSGSFVLLEEGDFSVLCEEDILITESGAEFLSSRQTELVLVPCTNTKGGQ